MSLFDDYIMAHAAPRPPTPVAQASASSEPVVDIRADILRASLAGVELPTLEEVEEDFQRELAALPDEEVAETDDEYDPLFDEDEGDDEGETE